MIVEPAIERYIDSLHGEGDPLLAEMEAHGRARDFPLVGPRVGQLLAMLVQLSGVEQILECGSGFGYSALWMARALPPGGQILLTDYDRDHLDAARGYFERAGLLDRAIFHPGNALELLPSLASPFDLIFNDANKKQYPELATRLVDHLRPGGLLVTDNVLWRGKVVEPEPDENTRAVLEHNRRLFSDPRLSTTLLPVRDGLTLSIRRPVGG